MRHTVDILLVFALTLLSAACDNKELVSIPSSDFAAPKQLSDSKWTITQTDPGFKLTYSGELKGGGKNMKTMSGELIVAKEPDMSSRVAWTDVSVVGTHVEGDVRFELKGAGSYYAQVVVYGGDDNSIYSGIHTFALGAPSLSTEISDIGWYGCLVSSMDIQTYGLDIIEMGVIYSCNPANMTLETANRKYAVHESTNWFDSRAYVGRAAEDAGLDPSASPTYYIRTYATISLGTGYGPVKQFKTIGWPEVVSDVDVINITSTSAVLNYTWTVNPDDPYTSTAYVVYGATGDYSSGTRVEGHSMKGLSPGTTYYCWYSFTNELGEDVRLADALSFETSISQPTAVDLGLPSGLKWADRNLGAASPEGYGNYYAWGETGPKDDYSWATYKWCDGTEGSITKYNWEHSALDMEDDAARAVLGGTWRMPTYGDATELLNNCTWTWTTENGKAGYLVTGPNGKSIFLPAGGRFFGKKLDSAGSWGSYWTLTMPTNISGSDTAYEFYFYSTYHGWSYYDRCYGLNIRPVTY